MILNLNMKNYHISYTFFKNLNPITTIWPLFPFQGDTEQSTHRALANI